MVEPPKLLVSACLLGRPVRYDGTAKTLYDDAFSRWRREGRVVAVCPEALGGLPTPRLPAEIADTLDGRDVLEGRGRVVDIGGADITSAFVQGAGAALKLAVDQGCRFALLIDGSPSCGSAFIYDGSFTGRRHTGEGIAAALLRRHGITVFAPNQIHNLAAIMDEHGRAQP
ncbi:DUF523 domain-containing protein [Sphingomonas prati]|uniref:Uncharacterized protein YbbK (DUF523 family) n=1 Tax=Sphingomonas prati TaxID=1843237 RepID=A0A7W9F2J3_9SPHN|nr:DUF523 domain-containing protein [Sphingomonas prati]MBB5730366.1 uncharacterized protein YbbK (DUF523 family) [Sphingomonas prati]GGE93564.1 hypothetical protein GCM10011404_28180 [Sphingomonas prati]